jgi:hypothetical protein
MFLYIIKGKSAFKEGFITKKQHLSLPEQDLPYEVLEWY